MPSSFCQELIPSEVLGEHGTSDDRTNDEKSLSYPKVLRKTFVKRVAGLCENSYDPKG